MSGAGRSCAAPSDRRQRFARRAQAAVDDLTSIRGLLRESRGDVPRFRAVDVALPEHLTTALRYATEHPDQIEPDGDIVSQGTRIEERVIG